MKIVNVFRALIALLLAGLLLLTGCSEVLQAVTEILPEVTPVITEDALADGQKAVLIGNSEAARALAADETLGEEDFHLVSNGNRLAILGGGRP